MSSRTQSKSQQKRPPQQKNAQKAVAAPTETKRDAEAVAAARARDEAKQQARLERQAAARAEAARRRRMRTIRNAGIIALLAVFVIGGIAAYAINEANKPGESISMQPSPHIATVTTAHAAYITDPPTSGPHVADVPGWGVSDTQYAKELQVHALEDAGVVINYRPDLDKATIDRLAALTRSYDKEVLLSPYEGLKDPIVLTAWTRMDKLQTFDEARIKRFISAYRGIDHHKDSGS